MTWLRISAEVLSRFAEVIAVLPDLQGRDVLVFAVSTNTPASHRAAAAELGHRDPLTSDAPTVGWHPMGSAYSVYHVGDVTGAEEARFRVVAVVRLGHRSGHRVKGPAYAVQIHEG